MKTKLLLAFLLGSMASANAFQIMLDSSMVVGGNGEWNYLASFNAGPYNAFHVVDQQTGPVMEPTSGSYWLGRQYGFNEFFVIDLKYAYDVNRLDLFNTHNASVNDRATYHFIVSASNSVTYQNADNGYYLSSPTPILAGTLSSQTSANDPIEADVFGTAEGLVTGTAYRYLQFTSVDYYGYEGGGLNEIRVYGTPEPSALVLLGAGMLTLARRRRSC